MNTRDLSLQLTALSDSVRTTFQLISRLSKLTFTPGSTPLQGDGDVRVELVQDIHESLKQHEETLELLRQEVEDSSVSSGRPSRHDSEKGRERARLTAQTARLGEDLKHARSQFRRAQLTAKRNSEAAKQREREILFASLRETDTSNATPRSTDLFAGRRHHPSKHLTEEEILVNASSDVTSALRQTHDLLSSELSRSRFAQETLDQSTAALADLGERYGSLDTLLANSKNLLGTLVRSQKSDTWYLETAFYILIVTLCWLVFRRLIYGPAWWFVWLPTKYFILKPFSFIFAAFGITGGARSSTVASSSTSLSRPSLKVQPSASGGIPRFSAGAPRFGPAIPVGGGGGGAKMGQEGKPVPHKGDGLSEQIGQMAEASRQEVQQGASAPTHAKEPVKRADGTVLEERNDKPRNPKKKMFEADVEDAKHERQKRDEL